MLRHFSRHPLASLIQIAGLSVGFLCFLVGFGAAYYWSMSDRQYPGSDRTYVLTQDVTYKSTPRSGASASAAYHVAKYVRSDIPELDAVARSVNWSALPVSAGDQARSLIIAGADPDFFRIFRRPSSGPSIDALRAPRSVVVTPAAANTLYGSLDVIGRTLRLNEQIDLNVTGVFEPSQPSHMGRDGHLRFDLLVSWDVIEALIRSTDPGIADENNEIWFARCCATYVQLPRDDTLSAAALQQRLHELAQRRVPASQRAFADIDIAAIPVNALQSLEVERLLFANSGVQISLGFALFSLASAVLLVACLNYANLAAAQILDAAGQLGVRRILGADRWTLAAERLLEAMLCTTAALVLALLIVAMFSALLPQYLAVDLHVLRSSARFWIWILVVWALATCVAGFWPALLAFFIRPRDSLRPMRGRAVRGWRAGPLVVAQFATASLLVSIAVTITAQHRELERIGLDGGKVVAVANNLATAGVSFDVLKAGLLQRPQIQSVSASSVLPWEFRTFRNPFSRSPAPGSTVVNAYGNTVWYDYFETMDVELLAGRTFSVDFDDVSSSMFANPSKPIPVVIDRALSAQLGFAGPPAAVDRLVYIRNPFAATAQVLRIIGVVENKPAHFVGGGTTSSSYQLHSSARFPLIRIHSGNTTDALAAIDATWRALAPQIPLQRQFVDDLFNRNYEIFARIGHAFRVLVALALTVACLGLFAMSTHVVRARIHEIGVRKTLGASASRVLAMLMKDFSRPVLIANLLALPLALLAARIYLNVFIHRLPLSAGPFLVSLGVTLIAAWAAVALQATRAAWLKPATVLRHE